MADYVKLFSLDKKIYAEGSPVIVDAGVLFSNTKSGKLHVQLKFENLSEKIITMLKAELILKDSIGREIGHAEKQYIDIKAERNSKFGENIPIYLSDSTVRELSVSVKEVCFLDGSVWSSSDNSVWQGIPSVQPISGRLRSAEAIDEYKTKFCKKATVVPFRYKDLWVCACGNVNKIDNEKCTACGSAFCDIANENKDNIYHGAIIDVNYATKLTDTAMNELKGKKWVLRFAETDYSFWSGEGSYGSFATIVGDVTILRLKFETDGITYNLGVIDNKQSGSKDPVNETEIDVSLNDRGKTILYLLLLILLLVLLAPILPYILQAIVWVISLPIKGISAIGKSVKRKRQERKERKIYEKVVATIDEPDYGNYDDYD